jgi:hypothetical protein
MAIVDVTALCLQEILRRDSIPLVEVIKRRPVTPRDFKLAGPPGSPVFSRVWITSHDLANCLLKLKKGIDDFGDDMIAATNKMEALFKDDL